MFFRRFLSLALILVLTSVLSACASSTDTPLAEGGETVPQAERGNSTLIVRSELEELTGRTAMEAVENLNQRWLGVRRGISLRDGPQYARVVIDGVTRRELEELWRWSADEIEYMRYLAGPDATIKYGGGYSGGVIEVITRGGL
jgi:outer membrane receptor for ferrienterochelin and colicin